MPHSVSNKPPQRDYSRTLVCSIVAFITPENAETGKFPISSCYKPILRLEKKDLVASLMKTFPDVLNRQEQPRTASDWTNVVTAKLKAMRQELDSMGGVNKYMVDKILQNKRRLLKASLTDPNFQDMARTRGAYDGPINLQGAMNTNVDGGEGGDDGQGLGDTTQGQPRFVNVRGASQSSRATPPVGAQASQPRSSTAPSATVAPSRMTECAMGGASRVVERTVGQTNARKLVNTMVEGVNRGKESTSSNQVKGKGKQAKASENKRKADTTIPSDFEIQRMRNMDRNRNQLNTILGNTAAGAFQPYPTTVLCEELTNERLIQAFLKVSATRKACFTFDSLHHALGWQSLEVGDGDKKRVNADFKYRLQKSPAARDMALAIEKGIEMAAARSAETASKAAKKKTMAEEAAASRAARPSRGTAKKGEAKRRAHIEENEEEEAEAKAEHQSLVVVRVSRAKAMKEFNISGRSVRQAMSHTKELLSDIGNSNFNTWGERPICGVKDPADEKVVHNINNIPLGTICEVQFTVLGVNEPYLGVLVAAQADVATPETARYVVEFAHFANDFSILVMSPTQMMLEHDIRFFTSVYMDNKYHIRDVETDIVVSKEAFIRTCGALNKETLCGEWASAGDGEWADKVYACTECGRSDGDGDATMLLCDNCDAHGCHMECFNPVMTVKPKGNWHCSHCPPVTSG